MASDEDLSDLYGKLRAGFLSRHFALSRYFRGNHFTGTNVLDSDLPDSQILQLQPQEKQQPYRWRRQDVGENPLLFGGQFMTCLAVESALGHPHADRIIHSWLSTLRSLHKFQGDHFDGYILRWDPATSWNWTLSANGPAYSNEFLRDPVTGSYLFSPSRNDPRYVPFRDPDGSENAPSALLLNLMGFEEAMRYKHRQSEFYHAFRRWEPSMDELVGLVTGYFMVHKLTQDAGNRREVIRQVNLLGDYLAEHAYLLVRPGGGLTARGATGILPALEFPFSEAMRLMTGNQFASRHNFQQVMEKAGYWGNIAGPLAHWKVLGALATPVVLGIKGMISSLLVQWPVLLIAEATGNLPAWVVLKGGDLLAKLLATDSVQMAAMAAIYVHRDCFDLSNDASAQEVALAFALMENFQAVDRFRLWMYGTSFKGSQKGGFSQGFPVWLGLTGLDGNPLVGEVYLDWYRERQLHPELEPEDRTRACGCFASAVALLLSASPAEEVILKDRLQKRYLKLKKDFGGDLPLVGGGDTAVQETAQPALDFMSGLALAWLYRLRRAAAGQAISTADFPQLPDNIAFWPAPAVPESIIELAKEQKLTLPIDAIQKNPANLQFGYYGAPLFLESAPPAKPEPGAPPLSIEPDTLVEDKTITVQESDREVSTGVILQDGDTYLLEATGVIIAAVTVPVPNGPNGRSDITWDARFPLHGGLDPLNAHPFCLVGRHYGGYFFIGESSQRQRYIFGQKEELWLRINDDAPGNGAGSFSVRVRVWRGIDAFLRDAADGTLVKEQNAAEIYVIIGGAKIYIPGMAAFAALGFDTANVRIVPDKALEKVTTIPRDGTVLRELSKAHVYLMGGGQKRWIPDEATLRRFGGWDAVRIVPDGALAHIPDGPQVPSVNSAACIRIRAEIAQRRKTILDLQEEKELLDPRDEFDLKRINQINTEITKFRKEIIDLEQQAAGLGC